MIVEDEPSLVQVFQEILTDEGYEVAVAENGLQALSLLQRQPKPDLIISDLLMPGMGGQDLFALIRANPELRDIPAILITGAVLDRDVLEGEYLEVIGKPFDIDDVLRRVGRALANAQAKSCGYREEKAAEV